MAGVYSVIGAEIGAITAFIISRKFGREVIQEYAGRTIRVFDKYPENYLASTIFASRLLPIFNFDIISYASGLTNIKLWKFAVVTFFGMLPMTFLFSYSGKIFFIGNTLLTVILSLVLIALIYFIPKHFSGMIKQTKEV